MDAKDYLKDIDCFNTIYLNRDKDSNTMAKIMENYANEVVEKLTIPVVGNCTDCNAEINYKGLCEICHTEYMLKD